jgi:hypothetical protein
MKKFINRLENKEKYCFCRKLLEIVSHLSFIFGISSEIFRKHSKNIKQFELEVCN